MLLLKCLTIAFIFLTVSVIEASDTCEGHDRTCDHCKTNKCTAAKICTHCEKYYRLSSCGDCHYECNPGEVYNETSHECIENPCPKGYYFDLGLKICKKDKYTGLMYTLILAFILLIVVLILYYKFAKKKNKKKVHNLSHFRTKER